MILVTVDSATRKVLRARGVPQETYPPEPMAEPVLGEGEEEVEVDADLEGLMALHNPGGPDHYDVYLAGDGTLTTQPVTAVAEPVAAFVDELLVQMDNVRESGGKATTDPPTWEEIQQAITQAQST